jgi:hypothetical protein
MEGLLSMLVSLHFPCADARGFLPGAAGRLIRPHWELPDPDTDFVRHFGPLRIRVKGGSKLFGGEHTVCRADGALRFPSWPDKNLRCVFRGFFADGEALAKFDVGIAGARRDSGGKAPKDDAQRPALHLGDLVRRVLEIPAIVPLVDPVARTRLGQLGSQLARAYLRASTVTKPPAPAPEWSVRAGSPIITVLHGRQDKIVLPKEARTIRAVMDAGGVSIAHWWMPFGGTRRRVWLLGYHQVDDYALARQLRIDLVRLHCEREVLRLVLTMVATNQLAPASRSPESDALQRYLNGAINRVTTLDKDRQQLLAALVEEAQDERAIAELDALRRDLDAQLRRLDVRPNVRRKTAAFAEGTALEVRVSELDRLGLEQLITRSFSLDEYRRLCLAAGDLLKRDKIDVPLNADIVGGDALPDRAAALTALLDRKELLDYLRRAIEDQRPELVA